MVFPWIKVFFHGSRWFFNGSRCLFHGSSWFFSMNQGGFSMDQGGFSMDQGGFFHGSRWFFHGSRILFSWIKVVFPLINVAFLCIRLVFPNSVHIMVCPRYEHLLAIQHSHIPTMPQNDFMGLSGTMSHDLSPREYQTEFGKSSETTRIRLGKKKFTKEKKIRT